MRDYQRFPNDSFIAFKVPTPLKSILLQAADREGTSLSQFLRRKLCPNCTSKRSRVRGSELTAYLIGHRYQPR